MALLLAIHALVPLVAATAVGNAVLTVWATIAHRRQRRGLGRVFWAVLLVVVGLLAVQMAAGLALATSGARPKTWLHFLYGILVLVGAVVQVGLRPAGFLRAAMRRDDAPFQEPRIVAIVCVTQFLLIARAYTTGALGR